MRQINAFDAGLIALGAALNVSIGYLVNILKLPIYLDSIGTVFIAALCGWQYGAIVGISALIVLMITAVPTVIAYCGTAIIIALLSAGLAKIGFLKTFKPTVEGANHAANFPLNGTIQEIIIFPSDKTSELTALHNDIDTYYSIP